MIYTTRYDSLFRYYGEHNPIGTIDWVAMKAQGCAESQLDPLAHSPAGAVGIMQFMPATWAEWWGRLHGARPIEQRTCAERSIELGTAYMAHLNARFGNIITARAAYNWGMGHVQRHLDEHDKLVLTYLPIETQTYLRRIDKIYSELLAAT